MTPLAGTVTATRALYMSGNAVRLAAEAIRHELLQKASEILGEDPEQLDACNGEVFSVRDRERKISIAQLVQVIKGEGNPLEVLKTFRAPSREPISQAVLEGQVFPDYTFGSQAVEVEVNILTGQVKVTKIAGAYDVGRAINPKRVEGQIEGGIAQGLGYALMEEFVEEKGIPQNASLRTYILPTSKDIPDIIPIILESHSGKGPFGAKGVGEVTIVATAPAVLNAIYDAVGIRIKKLPATPETIFHQLKETRPNTTSSDT